MTTVKRWSEDQMIELAARGAGRVAHGGEYGPSRVTYDEIAAMTAVLVALGLRPIPPGMPSPETAELLPHLTIGEDA